MTSCVHVQDQRWNNFLTELRSAARSVDTKLNLESGVCGCRISACCAKDKKEEKSSEEWHGRDESSHEDRPNYVLAPGALVSGLATCR